MHKRHAVATAKKRWHAEDQYNLLEGADYEKSSYCESVTELSDVSVCETNRGT